MRSVVFHPQAGIPILNTWNQSVPFWYVHRKGECTHWCQPSVYQLWIYMLWGLLQQLQDEFPPVVAKEDPGVERWQAYRNLSLHFP